MTLLDLALLVLAAAGLASTARLAYEHHAIRAAAVALLWVAAVGHGPHSRPISRPRLRHRRAGRHVKPRKAVAA